jgi:leucyl-tRNA synthetase
MLVLMLSPMTPHIGEEMWKMLGNSGTVSAEKPGCTQGGPAGPAAWPSYREDLTREEQVEIVVQINGRVRGKILIDASLGEDETRELAVNDSRIAPLIAGKQIAKIISVPKKLVNIVLK